MTRLILLGVFLSLWGLVPNHANAVPISGTVQVTGDDCDGADAYEDDSGGPIDCYWGFRYDNSNCTGGVDCSSSLVIYFVGGGMRCLAEDLDDTSDGTGKHLDQYVQGGYIATAACVVEDDDTSDNIPFYAESARVDKLVSKITNAFLSNGKWTGENLLISGASHGAAAVMLSFVRTTIDQQGYMYGSSKTGICLYDPPLDAMVRETTYQDDLGGDCDTFNGTRRQNFCNRYKVETPDVGDMVCDTTNADGEGEPHCPTYDPVNGPDSSCTELKKDSLISPFRTSWNVSNLSHTEFKIVSCGNQDGDICQNGVPVDGPSEATHKPVCTAIDVAPTTPDKECAYEYHDNLTHGVCDTDASSIASCKDWFENL